MQTAEWNGARLCPAGLVDGHLHVLTQGDVVMALGHDAHAVLRAVDSESNHPDSWRKKFHRTRKTAGGARPEIFSSSVSFATGGAKVFSPNGTEMGVHAHKPAAAATAVTLAARSFSTATSPASARSTPRETSARQSMPRGGTPNPPAAAPAGSNDGTSKSGGGNASVSGAPAAPLSTVHSGEVPPDSPPSKDQLGSGGENVEVAALSAGGGGAGEESAWDASDVDYFIHADTFQKSKLKSVSTKTRDLCVLTAKLSAAAVVRDASAMARKKRREGQDERSFTPWITISRIAKMGNHILIMVDGDQDMERWDELSILLYRLRGNDGCNIKPIVVVSKTPPTVQELTVWQGCSAHSNSLVFFLHLQEVYTCDCLFIEYPVHT